MIEPKYAKPVKQRSRSGADAAVRNLWLIISLVLGFVEIWMNRFYVTYDGVSYLDMADAYVRHDWHTAINGSWNPLYSWIIACVFALHHTSAYWQYPLVQLVNYVIFLATIAAFEFFLQGLLENRRDASSIRIIAYGLFLWTSLGMIQVEMVEPDMLVALSVYLAFGFIQRANLKWSPVLLGVALATGFYAKSVMIPVSCIILAASWKVLPRKAWIEAALVFALLCSPLIIVLSRSTGHLTIGETGRVNYAWYVDGVQSRNWRGGPDRAGQPIHPSRIVLDHPRVYAFGGVFPVTYPMWYDFSYWFSGLHVWLAPRKLPRVFFFNAETAAELMVLQGGGFLVGWTLCFWHGRARGPHTWPLWHMWAVAVAAILLYCAVHFESRYLGAFFTILFLVPFAALTDVQKRSAIIIALCGICCAATFQAFSKDNHSQEWQWTPKNTSWEVASGMQKIGLRPGDDIGLACGGEGMPNPRWARLAQVHIVAELDRDIDFWRLDQRDQQQVLTALAASGAKMAVTDIRPPINSPSTGWVEVGSSDYFAYPLRPH